MFLFKMDFKNRKYFAKYCNLFCSHNLDEKFQISLYPHKSNLDRPNTIFLSGKIQACNNVEHKAICYTDMS